MSLKDALAALRRRGYFVRELFFGYWLLVDEIGVSDGGREGRIGRKGAREATMRSSELITFAYSQAAVGPEV